MCGLRRVIMGLILRMSEFPKEQQVGTFCITCAILTLPDVGPTDQEGQDAISLVSAPIAVVWTILLALATVGCCAGMAVLARRNRRGRPASEGKALLVYVTAQVTSAVIGTSAARPVQAVAPAQRSWCVALQLERPLELPRVYEAIAWCGAALLPTP